MDNGKTGSFIRELRKERGMTQKNLAEQLNITDRAVSKWERGLCAPDVALLEQLADILGCSVLDLIAGEREAQEEDGVKNIIEYSAEELIRKVSRTRKRFLCITVVCLAIAFIIGALIGWKTGYFFIMDENISPDETKKITVYDKALDGNGFSLKGAVSTIVERGKDKGEWHITYENCEYKGSWWSPDSKKYVLALEYNGETHLKLAWLEHNSESNLSAYLTFGVETTELKKYGYKKEEGWPEIEYQFLQWSKDSESMLIYYSFEDKEEKLHEGYFWYNCVDGTVKAILEI